MNMYRALGILFLSASFSTADLGFVDSEYGEGRQFRQFPNDEGIWRRSRLTKDETVYELLIDRGVPIGESPSIVKIVRNGVDQIYEFKHRLYYAARLVDIKEYGDDICVILFVGADVGYKYVLLSKENEGYSIAYACDFFKKKLSSEEKISSMKIDALNKVSFKRDEELTSVEFKEATFIINGKEWHIPRGSKVQ